MFAKIDTTAFPKTGLALLACLLATGCATEKALTEQTQPLQEQITRLEQAMRDANNATLREAREQVAGLAAKQAELDRRLTGDAAEIQALRDRVNTHEAAFRQVGVRLDEQAHHAAERAGLVDKRFADGEAATREVRQQVGALAAGQDAVDAAGVDLARRVGQAEDRVAEQGRFLSARTDAINAGQEADLAARKTAESAFDTRLTRAEDQLKDLSVLVQEAMAQAAKEIFLANGKEAFTVTLQGDKVIYPQNDPNVDPADAAKLNQLALQLGSLGKEYHLDIQGHTDNQSTDDNNYNLGKARAEVMRRYLHEKGGIPLSRMSAISYGANKPLDAYGSHNRRVYIRVLVLK